MHRSSPANTSFRSYVAGGARCLIDKVDDTKKMQECKINGMQNEMMERIESPQNYGFTSVVIESEGKDGMIEKSGEGFVQFMGGNRSFPVVEVMDDRRFRLRNQEEGEVAVYDDQQQSIKIKRKEIQTRSQKRITLRLIKDEDQHKEDAERDQQKHKDKPLSSMMFDKDTIEIIRTKDDGQLAAKKDEEDKKGTMKSRLFLTKNDEETDKITIETPNISIEWDEKERKLTLKTEKTTITMEDKPQVKISLSTEKTDVILDESLQKVKVGDKTANIPAAMKGSVDSHGDVIVARLAQKVLVK